MATCPNCNGNGQIHKIGGYGTGVGEDTMACPVCHGSGRVRESSGVGKYRGSGLPPLVSLLAFLAAGAVGYFYYVNYDNGTQYDTAMHAIILGLFVFVFIGVIYRIVTNPIRSLVIAAALLAADYFLFGGMVVRYLGLIARGG